MALFDKIGHVLTADITKDFKLKKKTENELTEPTLVERLNKCRHGATLGKRVHFGQAYLSELIQEAVRSCPQLYESNSTRVVILYGEAHQKVWQLVKDTQRKELPAHIFASAALKIDQCSAAFGTVLFYEDENIIKSLQKNMPFNVDLYPEWSEQHIGMAQYAIWAALADAGLGSAFHHYKDVDRPIADYFAMDSMWRLKAQLVFGSIEQQAVEPNYDDQQFSIFV